MTYYTKFTPFLHHLRENYEPCRDEIELIFGSLLTENHAQFWTYTATAATERACSRNAWQAILHALNFIQFGNFPDNPFLIRNVIVNIHSHTDVGMSHHILNNLHIQIRLCHPSTGCMSEYMGGNMRQLFRLSPLPLCPLIFFLIIRLHNIPENKVHGSRHHRTSAPAHEYEIRKPFNFHIPGNPHLKIHPSLSLKGFCHHFAHGNLPDPGFCLRHGHMKITPVSIVLIEAYVFTKTIITLYRYPVQYSPF